MILLTINWPISQISLSWSPSLSFRGPKPAGMQIRLHPVPPGKASHALGGESARSPSLPPTCYPKERPAWGASCLPPPRAALRKDPPGGPAACHPCQPSHPISVSPSWVSTQVKWDDASVGGRRELGSGCGPCGRSGLAPEQDSSAPMLLEHQEFLRIPRDIYKLHQLGLPARVLPKALPKKRTW